MRLVVCLALALTLAGCGSGDGAVTRDGNVIFAGEEMGLERLKQRLQIEKEVINATPGKSASTSTVILRADFRTKTGKVQEVIKTCQKSGFEQFALRAKFEEKKT